MLKFFNTLRNYFFSLFKNDSIDLSRVGVLSRISAELRKSNNIS